MGRAAMNLIVGNCLWVRMGHSPYFTRGIIRTATDIFGPIVRVDLVPMKGNPAKGGPYWCAVMHFASVKQAAIDELMLGRAIFIQHVRFTLLRSSKRPRSELEPCQIAAEAAVQAQKAAFAAAKALRGMAV